MEPMIRDNSPAYMASQRKSGGFWHYALLFLGFTSLGLGLYYWRAYGAGPAFIFAGIFCASLVLFFRHVFAQNDHPGIRDQVPVSHVLERVFARSSHAGIIVQEGRPLRANESYYELAEQHGLKSKDGVPPMPDTIFPDLSDEAQSAIYRLNHLDDDEAFGEESIEILSEQGVLSRYLVRVTVLGPQQYWEAIDYSYDASRDGELLSMAPVGLLSVSETGAIISANSVFEEWVGVKDGLKNRSLKDFIEHPGGLLDSPKDANRMIRFDTRLVTQKDFATPVVLSANWSKHQSGQYIASIALHGHSSITIAGDEHEDVQGNKVAVTVLESSVADIPFATVDIDSSSLSQAMIIGANPVFEKLTGISDWQKLPLTEVLSANASGADLFSIDPKHLSPEKPIDAMLKGKDGGAVSVYASFDEKTNLCRLYLVDITARKILEDQLVQSQKMQAIGRLVAEIAHDFNNLLAAIRLYTDTLLGRHPIGDPSYPELQQINANVNRAAALVKKLLAYSRKQTIRAENLDVSETLSDMAVTLKQVLGEKARLEIKHGRDLPPIRVDKSQFDTVLMNLAVNARDAMKGQRGGTITIQSQVLSKVDLEGAVLKASLEPISGERVVAISVNDTGTGMSEDVKGKIFEPFFTTKAQGEGTGLGLATVYGIVQQSGGHLAVDSEVGVGTTFTIYLPESDEEAVPESTASTQAKIIVPKAPSDLAGHGNILFVEDEDSVRVIAAQTLRKRGYTVIEACDGEEAYEILEEGETTFDLMISDVVMPGMDGPTLLKQARPILKETRIVFISGYAEEEFSDLLAEEPDVTFLPKPFTLVQLAEKVKEQIGEAV